MPRYPLRKGKQQFVPLPDPMTSAEQEINGVKCKVTSTANKLKTFPILQLEKIDHTTEEHSEPEDVDPKISIDVQDKPSSNHGNAKPKQLLLDPSELQSISKIQNWRPSIRNSTESSKTEKKILNNFTSQSERLESLKSNPKVIKSTQYQSVVWNPPLRRKPSATQISETPAKRAKILETIKSKYIPKDIGNEELATEMVDEDHNKNHQQGQSESQKASTQINLASLEAKVHGQYPTIMRFDEQGRLKKLSEPLEAKTSFKETLKISGKIICSPIPSTGNKQVFEEANEGDLAANMNDELSQKSEDMFLSQEHVGENLSPKMYTKNPLEDGSSPKVTENVGENFEAEKDVKIKKPNSVEGEKVNTIQELSQTDIFAPENENEDPFDINCITGDAKLVITSQKEGPDEVGLLKNDQEDTVIAAEEVFHSIEEKPASLISKSTPCEIQQEAELILSPATKETCVNVAPNTNSMKTPPNQFELDIFSCETVKRIPTEIPDAEVPDQFMINRLTEAPKELNVLCVTDINDLTNVTEKKIQSPLLDNVEKSNDGARSPDGNTATSLVGIVKLDDAHEDVFGGLEKVALKDEEVEGVFNVGGSVLEAGKHSQSERLDGSFSGKDLDVSLGHTELKKIFKEQTVQEDVSSDYALHLVEDKNVDIVESHTVGSTDLIENGKIIDTNVSVTNGNDVPKEVEVSGTIQKTIIKEQKNHQDSSQNEETNGHELETHGKPKLITANKILCDTEINLKLNENEKVLPDEGAGNLLQKATQFEDKDKIAQRIEINSKITKTIEKVHPMEVDLSNENVYGNISAARRNEDKMKPYTYEIEQDFDISHSQLIEIESAIMRESRASGPMAGSIPDDAKPREAATFPGIVTGKWGEARTAGFSMPRVPPLPALNWKKKVQEDRQKLRAAIHEISRLNAMLMSVRRDVWPTSGALTEPSTSNDTNRQGPGTGPRRY